MTIRYGKDFGFRRDKIGVPRRRYSKRLGSIGEKEMDVDDMNKEERFTAFLKLL